MLLLFELDDECRFCGDFVVRSAVAEAHIGGFDAFILNIMMEEKVK